MSRVLTLLLLVAMFGMTTIAHAADAAGKDPDVMTGTIYQSITAIIAFVLLFVILAKFAWGPIIKGLQDREEKIKADLDAAEVARNETQATLDEYKKQLADAQVEARSIIDKAVKDAEAAKQRAVSETEQEIQKVNARAKHEIELAKDKALQELYAQTAQLATSVAEKILQRQIDGQDTQQLVEQSLKELEQLN